MEFTRNIKREIEVLLKRETEDKNESFVFCFVKILYPFDNFF